MRVVDKYKCPRTKPFTTQFTIDREDPTLGGFITVAPKTGNISVYVLPYAEIPRDYIVRWVKWWAFNDAAKIEVTYLTKAK